MCYDKKSQAAISVIASWLLAEDTNRAVFNSVATQVHAPMLCQGMKSVF